MPDSNLTPLDSRQIVDRLRILDANANRATEGLRVLEEYARFSLEHPSLAQQLKQYRHDLAVALSTLKPAERLAARDTAGDVGTSLSTDTEYERASLADVVGANLARVTQALRCLEEYAKGYQPEVARAAEQIRYATYDMAKSLVRGESVAAPFFNALLYVLIDGESTPEQFETKARGLILAGVAFLQLREKRLLDRELVARARLLRQLTLGTSTRLIINDRPDIAAIVDADGVHVGQEELTVRDARRIVGIDRLVGVSTHDLTQAHKAAADGADYIGCGPTFASETKSFESFPGLAFLRQVAAEVRLPSFAIGGISLENLPQVQAAGFQRVAVSSAVWRAADPAVAAREFLQRLHDA